MDTINENKLADDLIIWFWNNKDKIDSDKKFWFKNKVGREIKSFLDEVDRWKAAPRGKHDKGKLNQKKISAPDFDIEETGEPDLDF